MPDPSPDSSGGPGRGPGNDGLSAEERAAFERRVANLDEKLDKVVTPREKEQRAEQSSSRKTGRGMAYGLRMASELVAAVLVGGLIGYGLDYLLGTSPWLFLIFFMLGFAAGVVNLLRAYRRLQKEIDAETGGYLGEDMPNSDDDD